MLFKKGENIFRRRIDAWSQKKIVQVKGWWPDGWMNQGKQDGQGVENILSVTETKSMADVSGYELGAK